MGKHGWGNIIPYVCLILPLPPPKKSIYIKKLFQYHTPTNKRNWCWLLCETLHSLQEKILNKVESERLAFTSYSIADLLRFLWFITVSEHLSFAVPPPSHCRKSLTPFCPALNTCRSIWSSLLVRWDVSSCGAFCEESIIFLKRFTNVCKTSRKIYKFVIWLNQENFYILNCPMKSKGVTAQMKALMSTL